MSNELIPAGALPVSKFDDSLLETVTSSGNWLPRLQLMTSASDIVKDAKFPMNHWAFIRGQSHVDLGATVDVAVLAWRPKAMELGDEILTVFDPKPDANNKPTGEFARIVEKSAESDSGCMYGPEFLVYIPQVKGYATLFCGSKTSRNEAPNIKMLIGKAATLASKKIETKKYTWYGPICVQCSTPIDIPSIDEIKEQINKFENPPESEREAIAEAPAEERAR